MANPPSSNGQSGFAPIKEVNRARLWTYSITPDLINLADGTNIYTFRGRLGKKESELVRYPDMPLPEFLRNSRQHGRARVFKANDRLIHFMIADGINNPTYKFELQCGSRWLAVPQGKKANTTVRGVKAN